MDLRRRGLEPHGREARRGATRAPRGARAFDPARNKGLRDKIEHLLARTATAPRCAAARSVDTTLEFADSSSVVRDVEALARGGGPRAARQ